MSLQIFGVATLTRNPEIRYMPGSGNAVANFGVATNKRWKNKDGNKQEQTHFYEVKAFGKTAELLGEYFVKGHRIELKTAHLEFEQWEDKDTGKTRSKHVINLKDFGFIEKRQSNGSQMSRDTAAHDQAKANGYHPADTVDEDDIDVDNLPF